MITREKKKKEGVDDGFGSKAEGRDGLAREAPVIAYTEKVILAITLSLSLSRSMYCSSVVSDFLFLLAKPDNRGRAASVEEVSSCFSNMFD